MSGREDQAGATVTKDSASGRDDADEDGRVNHTERPPEVAHGSRSGEGRARGTRAGGGGCARGKVALGGASGGDKACKSNGATVAGGPAGGPAAAACEGCGVEEEATPVDRELLEGFGVSVCRACKVGADEFRPRFSVFFFFFVVGLFYSCRGPCQGQQGGAFFSFFFWERRLLRETCFVGVWLTSSGNNMSRALHLL